MTSKFEEELDTGRISHEDAPKKPAKAVAKGEKREYSADEHGRAQEAADYVTSPDRFGTGSPNNDPSISQGPPNEEKEESVALPEEEDELTKIPENQTYTSKVDDIIEKHKGFREEDRNFFKTQYDKILTQNKKSTDQLQLKKVIGIFLDSMSKYAAASYGDKNKIDMTGVVVSPDWDWKGQQAEIDKQMDAAVDSLKNQSKHRREDTKTAFSESMMLEDLARREFKEARQWEFQSVMLTRKAEVAERSDRKRHLEAQAKLAVTNSKEKKTNGMKLTKDADKVNLLEYKTAKAARDGRLKDINKDKELALDEKIAAILIAYEDELTDEQRKQLQKLEGNVYSTNEEYQKALNIALSINSSIEKEYFDKQRGIKTPARTSRFEMASPKYVDMVRAGGMEVFAEDEGLPSDFVPTEADIQRKAQELQDNMEGK